MRKAALSLLLSFVLSASMYGGFCFAQADDLIQAELKLEQKAKEKGISVDELKAKCKAERQEKLEQKAKEMGITVDELKDQMKAKHQERLEEKARELGITIDELKEQMKAEQ